MNTANWIPDPLHEADGGARKDWTLFRSNEVPELHDLYGSAFEDKYAEYEAKAEKGEIWGHTMPALDLWKQMLKMLFETGHPWITFKDVCNVRSPQDHVGVIHSSNLCTEITLNTGADETAVCNLGSVVLDSHLKSDGSLDHEKLRDTIRVAVRAFDNVIDVNFYPTEAAKTSNMRHRPIGLGVMGLQNALCQEHSLRLARCRGVQRRVHGGHLLLCLRGLQRPCQSVVPIRAFRGSKWDRGILPQDSLELLEKNAGKKSRFPKKANGLVDRS